MNFISAENITKSYGEKLLFENLYFGIEQGEKIGLIAKNGTGKSTLLRILVGTDYVDAGTVSRRKNISIAFLDQNPKFDEEQSVVENIFKADTQTLRAIKHYESCLEEQTYFPSEEHLQQLHDANDVMDDLNAWDYETKVKQILTRLQISHLNQPLNQLSGGQRKRVALARVLIEQPDVLVLDEPTNHLDLDMIEWLEQYLTRQSVTLLMVTHDRYFLDGVCDEIVELENGKLFFYKGNYAYFLEKKSEREFIEAQTLDKTKNIFRRELEWMKKMPRARTTKSKSRIEAFYDIEKRSSGKPQDLELTLDVRMARIGGKILELKKVYKSFGVLPILKGFDYTFKVGERIGIAGKNGVGKSTFLNLISGNETADSGKINVGDTTSFGYFSQQGLEVKSDKRMIDVVKDIAETIELSDRTKLTPAQFLQLFQFPPHTHFTNVAQLSGGEKRRLHLLTILARSPNFLILDEPTNDLDLITLNVLEEFLLNFKGCLLIVSHDRYFMDKLVDHLFVFEGDGVVKDFIGNYSEYRASVIEQEQAEKKEIKNAAEKTQQENVLPKKKAKLSFKQKFELDGLEKELALLEQEKKELNEKLYDGNANHNQLHDWSEQLTEVMKILDEKSLRWFELSEIG
ncbi:MAG: ABC-F family ATP-binding cassette domain-containing protein [Ignavibacteriales bacterium]|nr:ABC-F family ATP-binding cassette domain-containing protein [Ignavibacteriales bacterium]